MPLAQTALLETAENVLLFLLFFFCSSPYRITYNSFSISPAEILAGVYILWRLIAGGRRDEIMEHNARWLTRGLFGLAVWSGVLWLLSINWEMRRSMVSDWWIAGLVFLCLLRSPIKDWKRFAVLLILAALPNLVLGILQYMLGIGLAPKDLSGWRSGAESSPIFGLFQHSNDLAVFLYWPFLLSVGLSFAYRTWKRLVFVVLAVLFGLTLYWTVSRSTLITLSLLVVFFLMIVFLPKKKWFLGILAAIAMIGSLELTWVLVTQSTGWINSILSGRLDLWSKALNFIAEDPLWLPLGYLIIPPPFVRVFWLPHNIYLLFWIEFGWFGILLLAAGAGWLLWTGFTRFEKLHRNPPAAIPWLGLAGIFLINGMVSLYLHETHFIFNFVFLAALWIIQIQEIDAPPQLEPAAPSLVVETLPEKSPARSAAPRRSRPSPRTHRTRKAKNSKTKR